MRGSWVFLKSIGLCRTCSQWTPIVIVPFADEILHFATTRVEAHTISANWKRSPLITRIPSDYSSRGLWYQPIQRQRFLSRVRFTMHRFCSSADKCIYNDTISSAEAISVIARLGELHVTVGVDKYTIRHIMRPVYMSMFYFVIKQQLWGQC